MPPKNTLLICLFILLAGCTVKPAAPPTQTAVAESEVITPEPPTAAPSATPSPTELPAASPTASATLEPAPTALLEVEQITPTATPQPEAAPTAIPPLPPEQWQVWPIFPTLSPAMHEIYQQGLALGNNPHTFSIIGDCQSVPIVFMGAYDERPELWPAWDYTDLQPTIAHFQGSFARRSQAVQNGLSVASVFSPFWTNLDYCNGGETPIECEFRLQQPIIAFINMGTNFGEPERHEAYLRELVEAVMANGTVPILSTKADNAEGDHSINAGIARVAYDYQIPLWNYWRAVQDLPNHGLDNAQPGGNYLTREAWDVRSIMGLQVLDMIWRELAAPD